MWARPEDSVYKLTCPNYHKAYVGQAGYNVYKLTCPNCHKAYVGQAARQFYTHYKEHESAFDHNGRTTKFTQHLQDKHTPFVPSTT